jgi:uncharacterized protein YgbK (DUF1537 family)
MYQNISYGGYLAWAVAACEPVPGWPPWGKTSVLAGQVAILADDLTGALDAAAAFATPFSPVTALWSEADTGELGDFAIDSETRDLAENRAEAAVAGLLPHLLDRPISFKKIDSLLRGNTFAEIAACARSEMFGAVLVAPAFPAQARITRQGRQYARADGAWQPVGRPICDELRLRSVPSRHVGRSDRADGAGVFVCDAEHESDLAGIAQSASQLAPPVLWCGSAGLAHALVASLRPPIDLPRVDSILALIGSRHPVSQAQLRRLAAAAPGTVVTLATPLAIEAATAAVAARLLAGGRAALAFDLPEMSRAESGSVLAGVCQELAETIAQPDLAIVAGGDTLIALATSLGATRLETIGEWRLGMPLSRFRDGLWRGTGILSKSGAFGEAATLVDAFASGAG